MTKEIIFSTSEKEFTRNHYGNTSDDYGISY